MHSLKNISPKKNDLKLPMETKTTLPIKNQDGRDNVIGMAPPQKQAIPHSTSWAKSLFKNDFIDAKSALLQQKQSSKNLIKRKGERFTNENEKKKIKPVMKSESILESDKATTTKKDAKRKAAQPKTPASYVCKYCCRRFRTIELLREHTLAHGSKPAYVCYLCGMEAGAFSSLMAHFVKHSAPKNILKSDKIINDKPSHDLSDFAIKSAIRCSHCKITFPSTEKLASHYCSIAGKKSEYNCAYCGQVSISVDEYRLHVLSHSVTPFLCMHCNFKGPTKKLLDRHLDVCKKRPKVLNERGLFKCKICAKECKHKKELNQHTKVCKQTSDSKVSFKSCPNCNSVFGNKDDFNTHVVTCSILEKDVQDHSQCSSEIAKEESLQKESFLCSHCGEIFYNQTDHENHQVVCFEDEYALNEKTSVLCQTCGSLFHATAIKEHQKQCLQSHEKASKEADKEIPESDTDSPSKRRSARLVCRKSSLSEGSPKSKGSPKKRKMNFQDCKDRRKAKFSKNKSIIKGLKGRRGRQSKVGNADFKCIYCDLTFCSKSTLLRHKRMHSGNPYFSCKYCGKFFFRKDVYTRHEVNVHSKSTNNAFCCYYCKLYFEDSFTLKDHVLTTHKENAFLPVKTEVSGDTQQDCMLSPSDIKKELNPNENKTKENYLFKNTNSKSDAPTLTTPLKKCGTCLQSFKNIFDIQKHMESHRQKEDSLSTSSEANSQTMQVEKRSVRSNKDISFKENEQVVNNDLLTLSNSHKVNSTSVPAIVSANDSVSNMENDKSSHISNSDNQGNSLEEISETGETETRDYICKLCLSKHSSQSLLTSHESTEHKIIDWYQCLVCDTSGPKQDMIEHTFSHMYKVGTIVVSNSSNNLDTLLPYIQKPMNSENSISGTCTAEQIENTFNNVSMGKSDEISHFDLPPLIDYGSSSSCILKDTNSLPVEAPSQNKDDCTVLYIDNIDDNLEDQVQKYPEEDIITVPQKPPENESVSQSVVDQIEVNERLSIENNNLECLVSPEKLSIPSSNNITTNVLVSSLTEENIEQSKEPSKETSKIDSAASLSPKPLLVADEVGNSGDNTNKASEEDDGSATGTNFSQLRYLLENFKKKDPLDTVECVSEKADEPNYQLHIVEDEEECNEEYSKRDSLSWLNSLQSDPTKDIEMNVIKKVEVKQSDIAIDPSLKNIDSPTSFNKLSPKSVAHFPKVSPNSCKNPALQPELNQNANTCLKFDINQSRSIFAENDLFQTSQVPSKILDFSDLISDSINVSDNIFQCDQVQSVSSSSYNVPNKFTYTSSNKSLFFPESMKCNSCNLRFNDANEISLHICSKNVTFTNCINSTYNFEPKNIFLPPTSRTSSPGMVDYENAASTTEKYPTLESIADIFGASNSSSVSNKVQSPQYESEQINNSLSKNMCNKCYRTFRDAKECAKHSSSCSKLAWCKNNASDTLKFPETLHSLLAKREVRTQQQSYSASVENDNASYDTVLNLSKNPFSS